MKDDMNIIMANNIKDLRKKQGITQAELAERADISIETIKRVETSKAMSLDTFCRITEALKTTPSYILCEDKEKLSYNERFEMITAGSVMEEMEYILFMIEKMIEGRNRFRK